MAFLMKTDKKQRLILVKAQWKVYLITTAICLLIALFASFVSYTPFIDQLRYSFGYGYSIIFFIFTFEHLFGERSGLVSFIGLVLGFILGSTLLVLNLYDDPIAFMLSNSKQFLGNLSAGLIFSLFMYYYFYSREILHRKDLELKQSRLEQSEKERALVASQLQVMQSQMEPHFLFNTLATIQSLIDIQPKQAQQMLGQLTDMLRISLKRSRDTNIKLSEEIQMVSAYLEIQKTRMAGRLNFEIAIQESAKTIMIPPYLIQPLVENAVIHGIEPSAAGGMVSLTITEENDRLAVSIVDDGLGFNSSKGHGLSLKNIHHRLEVLYGTSGSLTVKQNSDSGVTSTLILPVTKQETANAK